MTQKAEWTEKHRDYAIANKLPASAWALWEWLVQEGLEGKEETVDLREFNRHIASKRGKPFDRRTVKDAARRLQEAGILKKCQKFTEFVWHWLVRSIAILLPPLKTNKNCRLRSQSATNDPSNPSYAEHGEQAAAASLINELPEDLVNELEENIDQLEAVGIKFDPKDIPEVLAWEEPGDVKSAIALFQRRGGHQKIKNAEGWMRRCLERRWWEPRRASFTEVLLALASYFKEVQS